MKEAFDDLSKALAGGMSRREALRRFGVVALGAAFAVFRPGRAAAAGISDCNEFCDYMYGRGTKAAAACLRDAVRHGGACFECGPASRQCEHVHCPRGTFCMSNNINHTNSSGPFSTICVPY